MWLTRSWTLNLILLAYNFCSTKRQTCLSPEQEIITNIIWAVPNKIL